jgi:DnaJ-class molecular chaperone
VVSGGSPVLVLIVLVVVLALGYVVSVFLHPFKICPACKGTPRSYGSMYTKSFRLCDRCGGSGRVRRLGAGDG